jgi:hypothetical protein
VTPAQPPARTGKQVGGGVAGMAGGSEAGYGPPPEGSYQTYRRMRSNPTIAMARIAATAPIRRAAWSFEARDGTPDERVRLVQSVIERLRSRLVKDAMSALDYGWAPFEIVWTLDGGRAVPAALKPLSVDLSEPLVSESGALLGVRNGKTDLTGAEAAVFVYDAECDNWFGRSRHENVRGVYAVWTELTTREGQWVKKAACPIPIIEYPDGTSMSETGAERPNFELAKLVLANLGRGDGVAMPNVLAKSAEAMIDMSRAGVSPSTMKAWNIDFLTPGNGVGADLVSQLRHKESLMFRGWMIPERAASEGQFGTKAEAESHGDLAVSIAELDSAELVAWVNAAIIDPMLRLNFGNAAAGSVYAVAAPMVNSERAFARDVLRQALTNPANIDLLLTLLDVDAMLDSAGLPKAAEVVDVAALRRERASAQADAGVERPAGDNGPTPDAADIAADTYAGIGR